MKSDASGMSRKRESEKPELKAPGASLDDLGRTVCGMLNQQGGVVLWGVDARGKVVGVEDAARQAEELNAFLMQHMNPRPLLSVTVLKEDEKSAVVVDVPPGADKPYSIRRQIWVRLGPHTLRADEEASASLVERSAAQLDRWEREPMPGFGIADCDAKELARTRGEIESSGRFGIDVPATDEDLLRGLYVFRNGQLTNGAVVLFAQSPRAWAPNLGLRIVSVPGDGSGPMGNDTVLEGPAVKVLREAIDVIRQRTGYSARLEKGKLERKEQPAYALSALREGLVNATAHRDYAAVGGDIRVEILPESLVIRNPGRLPTGWTPGTLRKPHGSHLVNPDIARLLYLLRLMERLGRGAGEVIRACRELGAKEPLWRVEPGTVALTLFRAPEPPQGPDISGRQAAFLGHVAPGRELKAGEYALAAGVSGRQARRDLAELEEWGLLERRGKGPATLYRRTSRKLP